MGLICTNLANYGAPPCMYIYVYIYHLAKIPIWCTPQNSPVLGK